MQQGVHRRILDPIRRLQHHGEDEDEEQHRLIIDSAFNVNCQSVQYLVNFLSGDTHQLTELVIVGFSLARPSDGGLNILCDFFTNQTTLTRVKLQWCNFGSVEEASRLIAAFQTTRSVTGLTIYRIEGLRGAALGHCLSGVLQNNPRLERLELGAKLDAETVHALQPGLRTNRNLKILDLSYCDLEDEGFHHIVDALVGNTTMVIFDCSGNEITSNVIADITRLVKFTQLKSICAVGIYHLFADADAMKSFISVLRRHTCLEKFRAGLDFESFPHRGETIMTINNILTRNVNIRRAKELLALQPRTGLPIASKSGIWYMAMAKMAEQGFGEPQLQSDDEEDNGDDMNDPDATVTPVGEEGSAPDDEVQSDSDDDSDDDDDSNNGPDAPTPNYPGASAIFKIFQTRPAIIEKQLRRPTAAAQEPPCDSSATKEHDAQDPTGKNGGGGDGDSSSGANDEGNSSLQSDGRKRQRTL